MAYRSPTADTAAPHHADDAAATAGTVRLAVLAEADYPGLARVDSHSLSTEDTCLVPEIPGLRWIGAHAPDVSTEDSRIVSRHASRREQLHQFLAPRHPAPTGPATGSFVQHTPSGQPYMVFGECWWAGHRSYAHIEGASDLPALHDSAIVQVVVGTCNFGAGTALFVDPAGIGHECPSLTDLDIELRAITIQQHLGLYERETILRLTAALGDLLAILPPWIAVVIVLDVPRVQYYPYLLRSYRRGRVPHRLLTQWWRAVDQRQPFVRASLKQHVELALRRAGRVGVPIVDSCGLDAAEPILRDAISRGWPAGHRPDPEARLLTAMSTALRSSANGQEWDLLLEHAAPASFDDLALTSYVHPLIQPQLRPGMPQQPPTVTIMLDDPSELRTYRAARRLARTLAAHGTPAHPVAGIFPLRRLFRRDQPGHHSLYRGVRASGFRTPDAGVLTSAQLAALVHSWDTGAAPAPPAAAVTGAATAGPEPLIVSADHPGARHGR